MKSMEFLVRRISVVSARPFDEVVQRLTATIGHPDMAKYNASVTAAKSLPELEAVVKRSIGPSRLMEFIRFDEGEILQKAANGKGPRALRFLIGNPLIMRSMALTVPDVSSYAPLTVLVDERPDGVHLSYDSMESLLRPYNSEEALKVAREMDQKMQGLLEQAAGTNGL